MTKLNQDIFYDFGRLASVCAELDFQYEKLSEYELKVILRDDLCLFFVNLMDDINSIDLHEDKLVGAPVVYQDIDGIIIEAYDRHGDKIQYRKPYTMAYMGGESGSHLHGTYLQLGAQYDPDTYQCTLVHYLDIPLLIRTGEIFIYERYVRNRLWTRWLVHHKDLTKEFDDLEPGEEVRIIRL